MTTRTTTNPYPDVPPPAGAVKVDDWMGPRACHDESDWVRYFEGPAWVFESTGRTVDPTVLMEGIQFADGRVDRAISVGAAQDLTADQSRELTHMIIAAGNSSNSATDDGHFTGYAGQFTTR